MPRPKHTSSEKDWENHKDLISQRILSEEVSFKDCLRELEDLGFHVTQRQLEYRLRKWGFKRNIPAKGWRYIDHKITKRNHDGKQSMVVFGGHKVKGSRVQKECYRNRDVSALSRVLGPASPQTPPGLDIQVLTPPAHESTEWEYPQDLPWYLFERESCQILLRFFCLRGNNGSSGTISRSHGDWSLGVDVGYAGVPRPLEDPSVTADLLLQLRQLVLPEAVMPRVSSPKLSQEVLKTLIFVFSNRLGDLKPDTPPLWQGLLCLMQRSGTFDAPLDAAALRNTTIRAFAEHIFHQAMQKAVHEKNPLSTTVLKWILSSGLDPNSVVPVDRDIEVGIVRPLHYACGHGATEVVRCLLDSGADANLVDPNDDTPIHALLDYGGARYQDENQIGLFELDIMRYLTSHGADINPDMKHLGSEAPTPLMKAIGLGSVSLVEFFIQNGANLSVRTRQHQSYHTSLVEYRSPLSAAAGYRDDSTATELVVLMLRALSQQYPELPTESFVDLNVVLSAAEADNVRVLRLLHRKGHTLDEVHDRGYTALHAAAARGSPRACQFLIERGVPIDPPNPRAPSPLHLACTSGHLEAVKLLYEQGVREGIHSVAAGPMDHCTMWTTPFRATLSSPCSSEGQECALFLLKQGTSFSPEDVTRAIDRGYYDLAEVMIRSLHDSDDFACQADCQASDYPSALSSALRLGPLPLEDKVHIALRTGVWNRVEAVLADGFAWDRRSTSGASNLETALLTGSDDIIACSYSIDPSFYDGGALCAAAAYGVQKGDHKWVHALLENRHGDYATDALEGTALAVAIFHGDYELVQVLCDTISAAQAAVLPRILCSHGYSHFLSWLSSYIGVPPPQDPHSPVAFWRTEEDTLEASPLAAGIARGDLDLVRRLIDLGFRADRFGLTVAAYMNSLSMVDTIAKAFSDNTRPSERTTDNTPMYWATHNKDVAMIQELAALGENWEFPFDDPNVSPSGSYLQMAVTTADNLELVGALLALGDDVNAPPVGPAGATALQLAAFLGTLPVARRLLEAGADVNATSRAKLSTALVAAASRGRIDMIQLLLSSGARTTGPGRVQYVGAVYIALRFGHYAAASILRERCGWTSDDEYLLKTLKVHDEDPGFSETRSTATLSHCSAGPFDCLRVEETAEESGFSERDIGEAISGMPSCAGADTDGMGRWDPMFGVADEMLQEWDHL